MSDEADDKPTYKELDQFFDGGAPRSDAKKRRYRKHRGTDRILTREYGRDLADVIKMRYVQGHSYEQITKLTGLSREMVMNMIGPFKVMMDDPERIRAFKVNEETLIDGAKMLLLQGIVEQLSDPDRRKKVDLSRLTYGFGILFDKNRLLQGQSTQNVMSLSELVRAAHANLVEVEPAKAELVAIEDGQAAKTSD